MLVSHSHRFIFLKTFKTAGTSVFEALVPFCAPRGWDPVANRNEGYAGPEGFVGGMKGHDIPHGLARHSRARPIRKLVGRDVWNRYAKIANVRNPYDKVVSQYFFHMNRQGLNVMEARDGAAVADFRRWVASAPDFLTDTGMLTLGDEVIIDRFIRYEALDEDMAALRAGLSLPYFEIGRKNGNVRLDPTPYWAYYDQETAKPIFDAFPLEFTAFGYDPDSWMGPPPDKVAVAQAG